MSLILAISVGLILLVCFIVAANLDSIQRRKSEDEHLTRFLDSLNGFEHSRRLMGETTSGLALDEKHNLICLFESSGATCLFESSGATFKTKAIIKDSDLLSVELVEDGTTVTSSTHSGKGARWPGGSCLA